MASANPKLDWCIVRLGDDYNWWVAEISDPVNWDVDGLGIIDPRQIAYIIESCESLREYGFDMDLVDEAFFTFAIDKELKDNRVRLVRLRESLVESEQPLFALPDVMDEEKGPYADFLDQITRARVKLLNDLIDFDQDLSIDELEEEIRERQSQEYMEGRAVHFFAEATAILDYVPEGYELDETDDDRGGDEEIEEIPEFEDVDEDEDGIEEDDTMKWDEEEDDDDADDDDDEEMDDLDDDDEDEDAVEDEAPRSKRKR